MWLHAVTTLHNIIHNDNNDNSTMTDCEANERVAEVYPHKPAPHHHAPQPHLLANHSLMVKRSPSQSTDSNP